MPGWLTDRYWFFDFRALWLSTLNARVPGSQKYKRSVSQLELDVESVN